VAERLFGLETEYAFSALDPQGKSVDRAASISRILDLARKRLAHLPGMNSSGIFLANGARFYVDCGLHPEMTTPECANPWDVVRYVLAGERILVGLADELRKNNPALSDVMFCKCNVDYSGAGTTWGCHESYMHSGNPSEFPWQIVPHLVSRIIYTGAGGLNPLVGGIEFTLSPRAYHVEKESSDASTHMRGIFHTKDESLSSRGYHRLHILGESLSSETAMWLKVGATALVVAMIENGVRPGDAVRLTSAVDALRRFAADPTCTVSAATLRGKPLTAIAIQWHYLEQAEAHLREPWMPPWAEEVCRRWHNMLDRLAGGAASVERTCDWAIKRALYLDHLRRRGFSAGAVETWTNIMASLDAALQRARHQGPANVDFVLSKQSPVADEVERLGPILKEKGLTWDGLIPFLPMKRELFEVDTRFGRLGEQGIFASLDRAGVLEHHFPGVDNIEHAIANPPAIGRAGLRGRCVKKLTGAEEGRYACDWTGIWDLQEQCVLDLTAPFATQEEWHDMHRNESASEPEAPRAGLREILNGLRRSAGA
jgi:proteasome accessory factor A